MAKTKILVCDDDLGITEVMQIILEENGCEVKTLRGGQDIQKQIKLFSPNLIFLDLWMPGVDGKEITKQLKASPTTKKIPLIIISALTQAEHISRDIGADGFLSKPFDIAVLLDLVKKHTSKKE